MRATQITMTPLTGAEFSEDVAPMAGRRLSGVQRAPRLSVLNLRSVRNGYVIVSDPDSLTLKLHANKNMAHGA